MKSLLILYILLYNYIDIFNFLIRSRMRGSQTEAEIAQQGAMPETRICDGSGRRGRYDGRDAYRGGCQRTTTVDKKTK